MMHDRDLILLVTPDEALEHLLKKKLSDRYRFLYVKNGRAAIAKVTEVEPDIIISQYRIAEMNGLSLCNHLKFDVRTRFVPFILLADIAIHSEPVTGIEIGPDKIVQSPYSIDDICNCVSELLSTDEQTISKRSQKHRSVTHLNLSNDEQMVLDRLNKMLNLNLSNADFSIQDFANEMTMSRMQLYRVSREFFDLSPTQLLKQRRLEKAAELLLTTKKPISQIAYDCGFSQPSYFSKCFKEQFGCSPKEYKKT